MFVVFEVRSLGASGGISGTTRARKTSGVVVCAVDVDEAEDVVGLLSTMDGGKINALLLMQTWLPFTFENSLLIVDDDQCFFCTQVRLEQDILINFGLKHTTNINSIKVKIVHETLTALTATLTSKPWLPFLINSINSPPDHFGNLQRVVLSVVMRKDTPILSLEIFADCLGAKDRNIEAW